MRNNKGLLGVQDASSLTKRSLQRVDGEQNMSHTVCLHESSWLYVVNASAFFKVAPGCYCPVDHYFIDERKNE